MWLLENLTLFSKSGIGQACVHCVISLTRKTYVELNVSCGDQHNSRTQIVDRDYHFFLPESC